MTRRSFLPIPAALPLLATETAPVTLGIDLFSLRSQNWTPFQLLAYCAERKAKVVHFSEIRLIGSLEPENLRQARRRAEQLGIDVGLGMRSSCPTSKRRGPKPGTA